MVYLTLIIFLIFLLSHSLLTHYSRAGCGYVYTKNLSQMEGHTENCI